MIRALVDTNVLLDYLISRPSFVDAATDLWNANEQGHFEGYIAAISPINVFYVARKLPGGNEVARQTVAGLIAAWHICPVTDAVLQAAVTLPMSDYEDAVQVASAQAQSIDILVTRDQHDFKDAGLTVLSPENFLALLNTTQQP